MKKIHFLLPIVVLTFGLLSSCSKEPDHQNAVPGEIDCVYPQEVISEGDGVQFIDNTLDVASREWSFQDGTPAVSDKPTVKVKFAGSGEKTVTLTIHFTNTAVAKKEMKVMVNSPFDGRIAAEQLTPMGCIKIGKEITFKVADMKGKADKYEWSFEGGNPATSSEAAPKVKFSQRDREMVVTCKMTRTSDSSVKEMADTIVVGNYPLRHIYPADNYDCVSFEYEKFGSFNCYNGKNIENVYSIAEGGACGTKHCLKINTQEIINQLPADAEKWADCFPRDAWASNVAQVKKGQTYEISLWMKADRNEGNELGLGCMQIISWVEDWMSDSGLAGITAGAEWSNIFGTEFQQSPNKVHMNTWYTDASKPENHQLPDNGWHQYKATFQAKSDARNVYPYFRVYADWYKALYIDELEINLVEE